MQNIFFNKICFFINKLLIESQVFLFIITILSSTFALEREPDNTPTFMTVGTQGTIKSVFIEDAIDAGAQIILSNTYHLMIRPGVTRIKRVGGIHQFMNCSLPILTDSGGFQIMSLSKLVKIDKKDGATFKSHIDGKKIILSPEKSIQVQKSINSDIILEIAKIFDNKVIQVGGGVREFVTAKEYLDNGVDRIFQHYDIVGGCQRYGSPRPAFPNYNT